VSRWISNTLRALLCLVCLSAPLSSPARSAEGERDAAIEAQLDEIRQDLAELRFEEALSSIEAFLAAPQLTEEDRVEALILRNQAHVSYGDLDAAEQDYRELLALRPAYVPEASLTPPKAMSRFTKVRNATVGSIRLTVEPPNATVLVDGREVRVSAEGTIPVLAGERTLRLERPGFDTEERPVEVPAGKTVELTVQLMPNARSVVIRTRPEGVKVTVDGVEVGETAASGEGEAAAGRALGELMVENLSLGEHTFVLSKSCFRSAVYQDIVTVDLTDYSPKVYKPMVLEPARTRLTVRGAPDGASIKVDHEEVAVAPVDEIEACPGERTLEIVARGRTVWRSLETFPLDGALAVEVHARPNAVLIGAEAWPPELGELAAQVNTVEIDSGSARASLTDAEAWERLDLAGELDLAVAVLPPVEEGSSERWLLYSPHLESVHRLDGIDLSTAPPSWSITVAGIHLVDSDVGGPALVAVVRPASPAAAAGVHVGERVLSVDGQPVAGAAEAGEWIAAQAVGLPMTLELASSDGEKRAVKVRGVSSPRLLPPEWRSGPASSWVAAWAAADGAAGAEAERPTALANLALLLSEAGRHAAAVETWRRVRWGDRPGVGSGTAAYYAGRALEALGREKDAAKAFLEASRSSGTAFTDQGPAVAPAAADHLADLGVSSD
jgi:tetratricopeptide (TPR) repeat protein